MHHRQKFHKKLICRVNSEFLSVKNLHLHSSRSNDAPANAKEMTFTFVPSDTFNFRVSATIWTRQMLADNRGWRIIERGGESIAVESRKSVPMVLMEDSQVRPAGIRKKKQSNRN